ncbi:MAG: SDR family oxidoreductase [Pseudomonadota bacterium]|nr:SDR family oxidoreductase [Pseudomonadota bacterium]
MVVPPMRGKVILLTGATSGIGRQAAVALAPSGATIAVVGRDPARTEALVQELRAVNPQVEGLVADLSSQAEVRRVAEEVLARYDRLDVLVNNAGALYTTRAETVDGIERTFALNHLAYFLLTTLLLDRLRASAPSRVVSVASDAHRRGKMRWDDIGMRNYTAQGWGAYGQSKLANILFTRELARRLAGTGVTANCLHPGFVDTGFARNNGPIARLLMMLTRPLQRRAEDAAETVVWAATAAECANRTGQYFKDCKPAKTSKAAESMEDAARLWALSEQMVARSA